MNKKLSLLLLLLVPLFAEAIPYRFCWFQPRIPTFRGPHRIFLGPEMYTTERTRGSGKQEGLLSGFRAGYDHIRRSSFYWAFEGYYARGTISGNSNSTGKVKSDKTDSEIEGRLGYTWKRCFLRPVYITPYAGYGYFKGINRFKPPSAIAVHFHNRFDYYAAGILLQAKLNRKVTAGFHYKSKWMIEGKSTVTNDPVNDTVKLIMNNERHYEYEFPVTFTLMSQCRKWEASIVPFYRYRKYGGRENFPFDYIATTYRSKGARFVLDFSF